MALIQLQIMWNTDKYDPKILVWYFISEAGVSAPFIENFKIGHQYPCLYWQMFGKNGQNY